MTRLVQVSSLHRRGNVLVLTAFLMATSLMLLAFAVDIGYLQTARVELQRTADAAAIASAWELVNAGSGGGVSMSTAIANARTTAATYAAANPICRTAPDIDGNTGNSLSGDVVVGYLSDPTDPSVALDTSDLSRTNAIQVRVRRTADQNDEVPLFFARVVGMDSIATQSQAMAAVMNNFAGFRTASDGGNLDLLPFALDKETWDDLMAGGGSDSYKWNESTNCVTPATDGTREVNLYPQGTGSPGNRGTVDIGGSNNSTADIARQIVSGISHGDLDHHGGKLEFDANGELFLNGDTGISAGVKDELASIIGKKRIIPIFESVTGPGNNAEYTIVEFAGVRIMDVSLTGKMTSKRLIVQPAPIVITGGIPNPGTQSSYYVYSPAWLVR